MPASPAIVPTSPLATPTDKQVCLYVAEMCADLKHLARRPRLRMVGYLLDMVRMEAERISKEPSD